MSKNIKQFSLSIVDFKANSHIFMSDSLMSIPEIITKLDDSLCGWDTAFLQEEGCHFGELFDSGRLNYVSIALQKIGTENRHFCDTNQFVPIPKVKWVHKQGTDQKDFSIRIIRRIAGE
jgi:hypothetical protein